MSDRTESTYYAAGTCVMAHRYGIPASATIHRGDVPADRTQWPTDRPPDRRTRACIQMAGIEAERRHRGGESPRASDALASAFADAYQGHGSEETTNAFLHEQALDVRAAFCQPDIWARVEALAAALRDKEDIPADEVTRILDRAARKYASDAYAGLVGKS